MEINQYRRASSLDEAYALINKSPQNCLLGGCTFLRKTKKKIDIAVDLSDCGLDYIRETDNAVLIGAYTSFRDVEISPILQREFGDAFTSVLEHLIGVQLRSHITVGAHVYSRYGFSDVIPTLLALNAQVRLYHAGVMPLQAFMAAPPGTVRGDILTEIILPKEQRKTKIQTLRNSYSDYSVFCLAVSRVSNDWIIAAGVRPGPAALAERAMWTLNNRIPANSEIQSLANAIAEEFQYGDNLRASAEYRKQLCVVFARRALEALLD